MKVGRQRYLIIPLTLLPHPRGPNVRASIVSFAASPGPEEVWTHLVKSDHRQSCYRGTCDGRLTISPLCMDRPDMKEAVTEGACVRVDAGACLHCLSVTQSEAIK